MNMKITPDSLARDLLQNIADKIAYYEDPLVKAKKATHPPVKKKIKDKRVKMPSGEYTKRMQYLLKIGMTYGKALAELHKYSPTALNLAMGNYDEKGQYDNVPNAGWTVSKITSLKDMDAISAADKINYGMKDAINKESLTWNIWGEVSPMRLAHEKFSDGGEYGRKERHINAFTKQLLQHMMNYSERDKLRIRDDPLSKLMLVQMNNLHDRLMYLTDDKKLQALTGVDLWENNLKKRFFIDRLYPTPLNPYGNPATWHKRDDEDYGSNLNPQNSDFWQYVSPFVMASPLQKYTDKETNKANIHFRDFLKPVNSVSDLTRNLLQSRQQFLEEFLTQNPQYMNKDLRKLYLERYRLWGYRNRPTPIGTTGIVNFTNMRGDGSSGLHEYRPVGMDIIEAYNKKTKSGPVDHGLLLKQIYNLQHNKQLASPDSPSPYRPDLPLTDPMAMISEKFSGLSMPV